MVDIKEMYKGGSEVGMSGKYIENLNQKKIPKITEVDTLIFCICIIDILFLPYIRIISVSISMILLPLWYFFHYKKINKGIEFWFFIILGFLVIFSLLLSIMSFPNWIISSNLKNAALLLYGYSYYIFFKYYFENYSIKLNKLLFSYILFVLALALIYIVDPSVFFKVRAFWTMSGNEILIQDSLIIHRFTSIFSDPNNAATAVLAVGTFLLINKDVNLIKKALIIIALIVIIFSTMSSSGMILLGIIFVLLLFNKTLELKKFSGKIKISNLYYLLLFLLISPFLFYGLTLFLETSVARYSLERYALNSGDSRFRIWLNLMQSENIFKYIILGLGGTIVIKEQVFLPHNGHLYLIYNYGMIVYLIFIYIFFRIRIRVSLIKYVYILPLLVGFTLNVGLYEPRFTNILALMCAIYICENNNSKFSDNFVKLHTN